MLLKVGELAKRTGLTVRTLHHYDEIGLLVPSARSDSGYRLYNNKDIGRLHAIRALRQVGIPLPEIAALLEDGTSLPAIIQRQIEELDKQISKANNLRTHLSLVLNKFAIGEEPDAAEWLAGLEMMETYSKYFSTAEIKSIAENWCALEAEWLPLIEKVRGAVERQVPFDSLEVQPLVRQWMDLSLRWMDGDLSRFLRWKEMTSKEPSARGRIRLEPAVEAYIGKAAKLRFDTLLQYFTQEELTRLDVKLEKEFLALRDEIQQLKDNNIALNNPKVRSAARKWSALIDKFVGHDLVLREKLLHAFGTDPLISAGSTLGPELHQFIRDAWRIDATNQPA